MNSHRLEFKETNNIQYSIGIDEVGRGPLAGPVTICAFAIAKHHLDELDTLGARDSKVISAQKRELVVKKIKDLVRKNMCAFHIVSSSPQEIDDHGLSKIIKKIIIKALEKLEISLNIHPGNMDIYLDGGLSAGKRYFKQQTIIQGDKKIKTISCASILAKVHRDQLMDRYDQEFPNYGFFNHKGYGTKEHYANIKKYGPCPIHRKTFIHEKK